MQRSLKRLDELYRFLASKRFAVILFLLISLSLVPGTLAKEDFHLSWLSRILFGCMVLNLLLCTMQRLRTLPGPVLMLHAGTMVVVTGAVISSFGYIATVNIYEGTAVDSVYRWDKRKDVPLGYELGVRQIHQEYYPVAVRVGVLRGAEKIGLFELKTGGSFPLGAYSVHADALDLSSKTLKLSIYQGGRLIASAETESAAGLPQDFPYTFRLVAYKNPAVKRVWVDLELARGPEMIAAGTSEVNAPFHWDGLDYYCPAVDRDPYSAAYAGIQIVKDPGRPVVFAGFAVICSGCLFWVYRKFSGRSAAVRLSGAAAGNAEEVGRS